MYEVYSECLLLGAVPCLAVPCCAVPCLAVLCRAVLCRAVLCRAETIVGVPLQVQSVQLVIFLLSVCHVLLVCCPSSFLIRSLLVVTTIRVCRPCGPMCSVAIA